MRSYSVQRKGGNVVYEKKTCCSLVQKGRMCLYTEYVHIKNIFVIIAGTRHQSTLSN